MLFCRETTFAANLQTSSVKLLGLKLRLCKNGKHEVMYRIDRFWLCAEEQEQLRLARLEDQTGLRLVASAGQKDLYIYILCANSIVCLFLYYCCSSHTQDYGACMEDHAPVSRLRAHGSTVGESYSHQLLKFELNHYGHRDQNHDHHDYSHCCHHHHHHIFFSYSDQIIVLESSRETARRLGNGKLGRNWKVHNFEIMKEEKEWK